MKCTVFLRVDNAVRKKIKTLLTSFLGLFASTVSKRWPLTGGKKPYTINNTLVTAKKGLWLLNRSER